MLVLLGDKVSLLALLAFPKKNDDVSMIWFIVTRKAGSRIQIFVVERADFDSD